MNRQKLKEILQPIFIFIIVFGFFAFGTLKYSEYKNGIWEKDVRNNLLQILTGKKSNLEKALHSRIYYTRGVAAYVSLNPEISNQEFDELANEYIRNDSVISTMSLARNGIINAIFPLKGHEAAIGLDLLSHPERKQIVEKTIETHLTFVAGPVELVEGGIAFISYTPIFDRTIKDSAHFWGVTDIVIKKESLIHEANLNSNEDGFIYALKGYNGEGKNGAVFWGDKNIFENNPVAITVQLPIGNWILAATPELGWKKFHDQDKTLEFVLLFSAFIISALIGLIAKSLIRIKTNERELNAVFESLDSLIIEFDQNGKYLKVNSKTKMLYLPEEQIVGKKLHDVFEKEKADFFLNALHDCIRTKKMVIIEYPLIIQQKEIWFSARLTLKSENRVIFNAYDITLKKKQEEQLKKSEKELTELNQTKDKFFSIIAHDLRGPLGSQKAILELILLEFEQFNKETLKKQLETLKSSTDGLHNLLENLLEWSLSQLGNLRLNMENVNLAAIYNSLVERFQEDANQKNISLKVNWNAKDEIYADSNLMAFILRNLLSNAIKFTQQGGEIIIQTQNISIQEKDYLKIAIKDNGTGMDAEKLKNLFQIDKNITTPGTQGEKGNGLGLILCKEFVQKQNGSIEAESKLDEGSTFILILPCPN